ncbi:MAG: Prephenate dehydrogenase [Verrucomicrobiales bacterium]|nr:Prephenate dehydrogenase [Verrucomicrobiales bacterium]
MAGQKITLIGVGLLGGSLGLAIKAAGLASHVTGFVRRESSVAECLKYGVVDSATTSLAAAAEGASLIIFCTPLGQMSELAADLAPHVSKGTIVTDVGSVKGSVVRDLEPLFAKTGAFFLGSHPMAGSEKSGVTAARADLFKNAVCVITPTSKTGRTTTDTVHNFWKKIGCRLLTLTPDLHDEFVSRSSHLPHVVAAELANYVLSPAHAKEQAMLCANGFRDSTRIAAGSPEMWRDISMANRKSLARVLGVFIEDLQEFQLALETPDEKAIQEFFMNAKERRDKWSAQVVSTSPE